jgi:NAD(P)H-flavin reductase
MRRVTGVQHNRRLKVHCVLEKDLYGHDLGRNTGVRGALTKYSRGHMGVVCGPGYLVEKIRKYLSDRLGYPFNSVVQIKM